MDYKELSEQELDKIKQLKFKPRLLLHACCGPCSSYVLEHLKEYFEITVFFYNPNIFPKEEYFRRLNELKDFYSKFIPDENMIVGFIEENYEPEEFYSAINVRKEPHIAEEPEKGIRCERCYEFRLKKSYEFAVSGNYDYFCTTLSISPFKDSKKINIIGKQLEKDKGPKWLFSDFRDGFARSLEISDKYDLYRQEYCGCVYSIRTKCEEPKE